MIRATEGIYRRQLAWRIPPDVIASAKNAQGEGLSWISRVIDGQDKLAKTTGRIRSRQGRGT
jgi:hypothetical protein